MGALFHHDKMHKLVENHPSMVQLERRQKGVEAKSSHDSLQETKEGLRTVNSNYLHLLLDRHHLLNLIEIYLDALRRKEDEVDKLSHELKASSDSLRMTRKTLKESEIHVEELCLELSLARCSSCSTEAQSSMASSAQDEQSSVRSPRVHIQDIGAVPLLLDRQEELVGDGCIVLDIERSLIKLLIDFSLWFGDRHVGNSIPAPSSWVLPPTSLIDCCPTLLVGVLLGYT